MRRQRRGDECAHPKSANRDPSHETSLIWKPFQQNRDRDDVAKSNADAANHAVREIQTPEITVGKTSQENTKAIKQTARHRDHTRATADIPKTTEESRESQDEDADRERQCHLRPGPGIQR